MLRPGMAKSLEDYWASGGAKRLPDIRSAEVAAQDALLLHRDHGGSTYSLFFGSLAGQDLYAVSVYPERSRRIPSHLLTEATLAVFIEGNLDLLSDPRCCVGTWDTSRETYLDVSAALQDAGQAAQLGMRYNQIAIYRLRDGTTIEMGGTGEPFPDLPSEADRLPPLSWGLTE